MTKQNVANMESFIRQSKNIDTIVFFLLDSVYEFKRKNTITPYRPSNTYQ